MLPASAELAVPASQTLRVCSSSHTLRCACVCSLLLLNWLFPRHKPSGFAPEFPPTPSRKPILDFTGRHEIGLIASETKRKQSKSASFLFCNTGTQLMKCIAVLSSMAFSEGCGEGFFGHKKPLPAIFPLIPLLFHVKHQRLKPRTGSTRKMNSLPSTGLIMQGETLLLKHMQRRSPSTL